MLDNNKQEKTPFEKSQEGLNESIKTEIKQGEASTVNAVQKEIVQTKEQVVPIVQSDVVTTEKIQEVHERATPAPLVGKRIENVPFSLPRTRTLVEVRPIERAKWHGKAGQESFQRPKKFQVLVDTESMSYATGLTNEEIIGLNKIVNYNLTNHFNQETPHEFWDSPMGMFKMENRTMFFDISQPLNYIKVKNMKASKYIANSMQMYEDGLFPEATHVIFDEAEQADKLATKIQAEEDAIILASGMSKDKKIEIILSLDGKNLKGQSDNYIKVEINKLIKRDAQEFLRFSKMNPSELSNYALVLECIQKSILRKDGHKILFHDSILGQDEVDVAKYLMLPENQEFKIRLMAQVN